MAVVGWRESIEVTLDPLSADIATVAMIDNGFAAIGLVNKYNSGGTFVAQPVMDDERAFYVLDSGSFLAYSATEPSEVLVNNQPGAWEYDEEQGALVIDVPEDDENSGEAQSVVQIRW